MVSGTGEKAVRESKYSKNGMHTSKIQDITIISMYMVFTKKTWMMKHWKRTKYPIGNHDIKNMKFKYHNTAKCPNRNHGSE